MAELVDLIAELMDTEYELIQDTARLRPAKSEIFRVRVDSSKARELLGWSHTVGLEEGLRRTIEWMRQANLRETG